MDQLQASPGLIEGELPRCLPRSARLSSEQVFAEMQASGISRRRAKKRLGRRIGSQLRYATIRQADGGVRLFICTPGKDRSIDLTAEECAGLAQYLITGRVGQ